VDIEQIEKILSTIVFRLEQDDEVLPFIQCQLLLHIYKKLDSIDDSLATMSTDSWNDHHNK
jgi:hypothetical protein